MARISRLESKKINSSNVNLLQLNKTSSFYYILKEKLFGYEWKKLFKTVNSGEKKLLMTSMSYKVKNIYIPSEKAD